MNAPLPIDVPLVRKRFTNKLHLLAQNLPPRFLDSICELRDDLPLILADTYPTVLTHGDLSQMNFLVDPKSGHLTGVIDWAEADVLPFGCALWGLENVLGYMDSSGWHYFNNRPRLENLFWLTLQDAVGEPIKGKSKAINVARKMGVLFKYGFRLDENLQQRIVDENDVGMNYLDAIILNL